MNIMFFRMPRKADCSLGHKTSFDDLNQREDCGRDARNAVSVARRDCKAKLNGSNSERIAMKLKSYKD
jgi:hypothetical protein